MEVRKKTFSKITVILLTGILCSLMLLVSGVLIASAADTPEITNVALKSANSMVTVEGSGTNLDRIIDGSTTNFWDGGVAPGWFMIDLGRGCIVSELVAFPLNYNNDGRAYQYEIYAGPDKNSLCFVGEKKNDDPSTTTGDSYTFETPLNIRYIYVRMTKNTKNASVHMSEFRVFGYEDPNYKEPAEGEETSNIAYNKPVTANSGKDTAQNAVDGANSTAWQGAYYPAYIDIDLEENYELSDAQLYFPLANEGIYYYYSIYGSTDGENYRRLYQKRDDTPSRSEGNTADLSGNTCRFIRVSIEYASDSGKAILSEIRIHGTATGNNKESLRDGGIEDILNLTSFADSVYSAPITEAETLENVYGIVERTVGAQYRDWFVFELSEEAASGNDYYELSDTADGKILIKGNNGVSLASGLNYYYKNYCNVHISEQIRQTKMPGSVQKIGTTVRKETPYKVRYAVNYCTTEYTFAFFDEEDFQRENDWLALNGVNVVLDLAGQEAVWVKFLMSYGYSFDAAKNWLTGPAYYGWQFMGNMESYGGAVHDGWIEDRLEMARKTQRWKSSLGIQTVLQGYAGMVPTDFSDYQPGAEILKQGIWCGHQRPGIIRTDNDAYDEYAAVFYQCQEWAFGKNSHYYAVDPFHEGGIRPGDLGENVIAKEVLSSLLSYDSEAVWVIQSWQQNPTQELLTGIEEYCTENGLAEKPAVVLDLTAIYKNRWCKTDYGANYGATELEAIEFDGTPWVWCLLKNYGANPSLDWDLQRTVNAVKEALGTANYMTGIGIISEATYDNPVVYDLFLSLVWEDGESLGSFDLNSWTESYILRRYGTVSANASEAWKLLLKTVYSNTGNRPYVMERIPEKATVQSIPYNETVLEDALELLLADYTALCECEGYRYDIAEIARQIINNYTLSIYKTMMEAYSSGDAAAFKKCKESFLSAFYVCDLIQSTQKDLLVGEWIGKAEDWAKKYDDFTYDMFVINAKALVTTWGGYDAATTGALLDYSRRHYSGMLTDIYMPRWQNYLDGLEAELEGGEAYAAKTVSDYFRLCWKWVINSPEYTRIPNDSPAFLAEACARVMSECFLPEELSNIALNKPVVGTNYNSGKNNVNDGSTGTYWDSGATADVEKYITIDLGDIYALMQINVITYNNGVRWYHYEVYTSLDNVTYTLAYAKETDDVATISGNPTSLPSTEARYIKVVGTGSNTTSNNQIHIRELEAYGSLIGSLISQGKDTTVSGSNSWHTGNLAVDGNAGNGSYWDCGDVPKLTGESVDDTWNRLANTPELRPYITVDLGAFYDIKKINVVNYVDTGRYYKYEIYVSADGENWVLAGEKTDNSEPVAEGIDYSVSGMYARYVKLVGTYHSRNTAFHLNELRVYGSPKDDSFSTGIDTLNGSLTALTDGYNRYNYTAESAKEFENAVGYAERVLSSVNSNAFALSSAEYFLQQAAAGLAYEFKLQSAALLIKDDVNIVYTAVVPDGYENVYMLFECKGMTTKVYGKENGDHTSSFILSGVLPQQFRDNITATLCATYGGEEVKIVKDGYSVREYCEYQLKNSTDELLITLLSDLLVYGAKAQTVSGYNTENLATDGLGELLKPSSFETLGDEYNKQSIVGEKNESVYWRGAGLRLEYPTAVYLSFCCTSTDNLTVKVRINGREIEYDQDSFVSQGDCYRIYIQGIAAAEFDKEITSEFYINGVQTGQSLTYSVNSYLYAKQNGEPSDMLELLKAIYNYGASVSNYNGRGE